MEKKRFIPKAKLSKKAKKELDAKQRKTWQISPVSRTKDNAKTYNRKRTDKPFYDGDIGLLFINGQKMLDFGQKTA